MAEWIYLPIERKCSLSGIALVGECNRTFIITLVKKTKDLLFLLELSCIAICFEVLPFTNKVRVEVPSSVVVESSKIHSFSSIDCSANFRSSYSQLRLVADGLNLI